MPLVSKTNGYPVEESVASAATVTTGSPSVKVLRETVSTQPSLKDRSIINQTAWKVAAMASNALANYNGSQEKLVAAIVSLKEKVEGDMLGVYEK